MDPTHPVPPPALPVDAPDERLAVVLAAVRLGDWSWDPSTDRVALSERAAEIFGIAAGPGVTRAMLHERLHPDDQQPVRLAVERALAERSDYTVEYRVPDGDGERWICATGRGQYDASGGVLGIYGVVQDVTRDRFLLRLEDALRPLADPNEIMLAAVRALGAQLRVNRCAYATVEADEDAFVLLDDYTRDVGSIVGRYRFRQFGAECLRLMRAGLPYVVADGRADPQVETDDLPAYELTAIRAVICVPVRKAGRFEAAMAVHSKEPRRWSPGDVELVQRVASRCWESIERARAEAEREGLLRAAEAAGRAKDEFLAMLGHELRNPLAPIQTALQLMRLREDGSYARERAVIERQVAHLTRLVDDLLDVARIAGGKVELRRERVELADVVARAVEVASPLLAQRAHALALDVPREGLAVEGDPARLVQVVSNLLTNAARYTPPGGHVAVTGAVEGGEAVIRVRDDGVGMAPEVLPHVFDLFVQGPQGVERASGGLGLGLSIVRSLVERHGGRVAAHSEGRGRGAEFVVWLPLAGARPASAPVADDSGGDRTAAPADACVLVVDDNEDAADMLAAALRLRGCEVHVARGGPQALRASAERRFDVALLDIGLPVMDGYELAARLRELPSFAQTRLVAVTGYGQHEDRRRAMDAGFHDHLVKPVDLAAIDAIIGAHRCARPVD